VNGGDGAPDDDLLERLTAPFRAVRSPPGTGTMGEDFSSALVSLGEMWKGREGEEFRERGGEKGIGEREGRGRQEREGERKE
jgi:hypothetical protein